MTEEKPEAPVPPSLRALLVVVALCFVVFASAGIVSEFVGAYWPREPERSTAVDFDGGL